MITLPASSRSCCGSHPRVAAHQRPSGRSHSARNDRSTITSPTVETTRSRTQISPGIHGAIPDPTHHNHSPPALTRAHVQISSSDDPIATGRSYSSIGAVASACRHERIHATRTAEPEPGNVAAIAPAPRHYICTSREGGICSPCRSSVPSARPTCPTTRHPGRAERVGNPHKRISSFPGASWRSGRPRPDIAGG